MSDELLDANARNAADYSEDTIRHLDDMTHIRMRPGMYIGRLGDGSHAEDGIYVLLKESIDNSIDEFNEGFGKKIEVEITDELTASIRDYGRGIPLGSLIPAVSQLNTGGKYDNDQYTASVGLNGVGLKAVNALSRRFVARACRDGQFREATFEGGNSSKTAAAKPKRRTARTFSSSPIRLSSSTTASTPSLSRRCSATTRISTRAWPFSTTAAASSPATVWKTSSPTT